MKWILPFLMAFVPNLLFSQGTLEQVSVDIDIKGTTVFVRQKLTMNVPDSIQSIRLKALEFKGSTFLGVVVANGIKAVDVDTEVNDGLRQLKLKSVIGFDEITVSYELQISEGAFYLPLFFTELAASSSDTDFFKMKMQMSEKQKYKIFFPGVPVEEQIDAGIKTVRFNVPALPSLVRMELFSEKKETQFLDYIDMIVALLFVGIGFLIWKYRKHLAYG